MLINVNCMSVLVGNFNEGSSVEIYKTPLDSWLKELDSYAARAEELANKVRRTYSESCVYCE
jgi:hypothetical protein